MGRKDKTYSAHRPNAPEFHVHQQPAHNPYYPDPSAALLTSPPPPYSDLTVPISSTTVAYNNHRLLNAVPMAQINQASNIDYSRIRQNPDHVIVQASTLPYDRRAERYNRRIRSFNNQTLLIAILAFISSCCAFNLYSNRNCLFNFTVIKPSKDLDITIQMVRDMHLPVAGMSLFIVLICLMKSCCGYKSKSYSCYLFIIGLTTFCITLFTAYLAYLAFWSTCANTIGEIASNTAKTLIGRFVDKLPSPENMETTNVFNVTGEDRNGMIIFLLDLANAIFYGSIFLVSTTLC